MRLLLLSLLFLLSSCFSTDVDKESLLLQESYEAQKFYLNFTTPAFDQYFDLAGGSYNGLYDSPVEMPFSGCVKEIRMNINNSAADTGSLYLFIGNSQLTSFNINLSSIGTNEYISRELNEPFSAYDNIQFFYQYAAPGGSIHDITIVLGNCY